MAKLPNSCPMCGATREWKKIETQKKGFSGTKAVVGGIVLGPLGALCGFGGKMNTLYVCAKCGFQHEYRGK